MSGFISKARCSDRFIINCHRSLLHQCFLIFVPKLARGVILGMILERDNSLLALLFILHNEAYM